MGDLRALDAGGELERRGHGGGIVERRRVALGDLGHERTRLHVRAGHGLEHRGAHRSGVGNREIGRAVGGDLVIALDLASGKKIGRLGARLNEPQVKELIVAIGGERLENLGEVEGLGGTVLLVRRLHERHGNRVRDAVRAHAGEHEQEDG